VTILSKAYSGQNTPAPALPEPLAGFQGVAGKGIAVYARNDRTGLDHWKTLCTVKLSHAENQTSTREPCLCLKNLKRNNTYYSCRFHWHYSIKTLLAYLMR